MPHVSRGCLESGGWADGSWPAEHSKSSQKAQDRFGPIVFASIGRADRTPRRRRLRCFGIACREGYALAPVNYPDNDKATLYGGTPWQALGDWETVSNLGSGALGSSALDLDFAHWLDALEHAKTTSSDDSDTEEVELASLDYLFTQDWE